MRFADALPIKVIEPWNPSSAFLGTPALPKQTCTVLARLGSAVGSSLCTKKKQAIEKISGGMSAGVRLKHVPRHTPEHT
jgi:hypothetical protein